MKNLTMAQKMRWGAGLVYGLLCLYQAFIFQAMVHTTIVFFDAQPNMQLYFWFAAPLIAGAGVMSVWMFFGTGYFSSDVRRAAIVGTVLVVCSELVCYDVQSSIINLALVKIARNFTNVRIAVYFLIVLRLMLLILGAFCVSNNSLEVDTPPKKRVKAATPSKKKDEEVGSLIDYDDSAAKKESAKKDEKDEENTEKNEDSDETDEDSKIDEKEIENVEADVEEAKDDAEEAVEEATEEVKEEAEDLTEE